MKKKHGLLYRTFVSVTTPFVLAFVFFWETIGQFLRPLFYVAAIPVILGVLAPNSPVPKLLGREGLVPFQLIVFFYFIVRPLIATLTLGLKEGLRMFLKDLLIISLPWLVLLVAAIVFGILPVK